MPQPGNSTRLVIIPSNKLAGKADIYSPCEYRMKTDILNSANVNASHLNFIATLTVNGNLLTPKITFKHRRV